VAFVDPENRRSPDNPSVYVELWLAMKMMPSSIPPKTDVPGALMVGMT
jgi:hypothetical protein